MPPRNPASQELRANPCNTFGLAYHAKAFSLDFERLPRGWAPPPPLASSFTYISAVPKGAGDEVMTKSMLARIKQEDDETSLLNHYRSPIRQFPGLSHGLDAVISPAA